METSLIVLDPLKLARKEFLVTLVNHGIRTFKEVGAALAEIRDEKLYLDEFNTFEEFCRQKWDIGQSRAYQLMDASQSAKDVSTIVELPNESAARPLSNLPMKTKIKVAKSLAKSKKPITQKSVKEAVQKVTSARGGLAASLRDSDPEPSKPADKALFDSGRYGLVKLIEDWELNFRSEWTVMAYPSPTQVIQKLIREVLAP